LEKLVNFRDMGGIKTKDGRTVKYKRLLRSGEPVQLPKSDIDELKHKYNLKMIVDLRGETEVKRAPVGIMEEVKYFNISLYEEQKQKAIAPSEKEFRKLSDTSLVISYMSKVYERLITDPFSLQGFYKFIKLVQDNKDGALLFHCYAGKDRTGIAAALIYSILGVSEEDIIREYMLTNELREQANREILENARGQGLGEKHLAALKVSYEVVPEYLLHAFSIATSASGSLNEHIQKEIGISSDDMEQIRSNYLE